MSTPTEPSLSNPAVVPATAPDPAVQPMPASDTIPDGDPVQSSLTGRRRTGKVACLPKTTRDLISQVNHAALQLGSLHILEALRDLKGASLDEKLGGNSAAFARLINALCRASKETLQLQKYREACAQGRAQIQPLKDPHRKLTEEETRAIVHKIDQILGLASPDDPPDHAPASPVAPRPAMPAVPIGTASTASFL